MDAGLPSRPPQITRASAGATQPPTLPSSPSNDVSLAPDADQETPIKLAHKRAALFRIVGGKHQRWAAACVAAETEAGLKPGTLTHQRAQHHFKRFVESKISADVASKLTGQDAEPTPTPPEKTVKIAKRFSPTGCLPAASTDSQQYEEAFVLAGKCARVDGVSIAAAQKRVCDELGFTVHLLYMSGWPLVETGMTSLENTTKRPPFLGLFA